MNSRATPIPEQTPSLLPALVDETDADPVLDLHALFGNRNPVEVELGVGKGRFLLDAAQRRPQGNYIGVECAGKYLRLAHERARKRGLTNVRFVHGDAREFVEFFLPSDSVRAFHVYFPDPWPKTRHHKRRLVGPAFLGEVVRTLEPGGRLWLATDHDDYFQAMLEALDGFGEQLGAVEPAWEGAPTNYEDKYARRGLTIHRRVLEKRRVGPG